MVVVGASPQRGGVGSVAALHAARSDFFSSVHAFLQPLNSVPIAALHCLLHLASTGEAMRPAPKISPASANTPVIPFIPNLLAAWWPGRHGTRAPVDPLQPIATRVLKVELRAGGPDAEHHAGPP